MDHDEGFGFSIRSNEKPPDTSEKGDRIRVKFQKDHSGCFVDENCRWKMTQLEAGVPPGGHCTGPMEADSGLDEGSSGQRSNKTGDVFCK